MAKLKISGELLSGALFKDADIRPPEIVFAGWDPKDQCVILWIAGEAVPDTKGYVVAEITTRKPLSVVFRELQ